MRGVQAGSHTLPCKTMTSLVATQVMLKHGRHLQISNLSVVRSRHGGRTFLLSFQRVGSVSWKVRDPPQYQDVASAP